MIIFTKISKKIAEIRLQPETVRLRYAWGSVIFSMLLIFIVWIFSIGAMFEKQKKILPQASTSSKEIVQQLQELKQQAPSLENYQQKPLQFENEGFAETADSSDFQYPAINQEEIPQTDSYSDLLDE